MSKKVKDSKSFKTEEQLTEVESKLTRASLYIIKNKTKLLIILGAVILFLFFQKSILNTLGFKKDLSNLFSSEIIDPETKKEVNSQMFIAQFHFENNNFKKALNGDSSISIISGDTTKEFYKGFLEISKDYASTELGNLASYYTAICQINLEEYEESISSLNGISINDPIINSLATGLNGDANYELGNTEEAMNYYIDAAQENINDFTTPYFMMKQAKLHHENLNRLDAVNGFHNVLLVGLLLKEHEQQATEN